MWTKNIKIKDRQRMFTVGESESNKTEMKERKTLHRY